MKHKIKLAEKHVQKACIELLEWERWFVFETHSHHAFLSQGRKGQPDLVAVKPGRELFIECKAPGEKQSPEQIEFQREAEAAGIPYCVIDDVDKLRPVLAAIAEAPDAR